MDEPVVADFASEQPEPGCRLLVARVLLLVVAVAAFGWAFMIGIGPIGVFGLSSDVLGRSMSAPIALGVTATIALLSLNRWGTKRPR